MCGHWTAQHGRVFKVVWDWTIHQMGPTQETSRGSSSNVQYLPFVRIIIFDIELNGAMGQNDH